MRVAAKRAQKKLVTLLDLCVSSLRRGHANLLCIVPILTDDPRRESNQQEPGTRPKHLREHGSLEGTRTANTEEDNLLEAKVTYLLYLDGSMEAKLLTLENDFGSRIPGQGNEKSLGQDGDPSRSR